MDGIGKAVGQQLGELGKHIATEVAKVPGTLTGMATESGTQETKGQGTGASKQHGSPKTPQKTPSEQVDPLAQLRQKEEIEKQKKLAQIRQELGIQFRRPPSEEPPKNSFEEQKLEELEQKKQEIKKMQEQARKELKQPTAKQKRGNLFGAVVKKQKQFGSEQSKNAVHQ